MKKLLLLTLSLSLALVLANCDSNGNNNNDEENNTPVLSSLSPSSSVSHMPAFTLTASGSKFTSYSKIIFNGQEKETTYISSTELYCQIGPDDTKMLSESHNLFSLQDTNVSVLVRNPSNEGGDSNSLSFTIYSNHKFMAIKNISNSTDFSSDSSITSDSNGNIYISWSEEFFNNGGSLAPGEIYFKSSSDGGNSWSQIMNLSNNSGPSSDPKIISDNNTNLYIVWNDYIDNSSKIYFRRSIDGGINWSQAINITNISALRPAIGIDSNGNILIVWEGFGFKGTGIYYTVSKDYGSTWSTPRFLVSFSGYAFPAIASGYNGSINVIWYTAYHNKYKIYLCRTKDAGENRSPNYLISTVDDMYIYPDIAEAPNGVLYAVWMVGTNEENEIYCSSSSDNGATWSEPVNISNISGWSGSPVIAIDRIGNINIAWHEQIGNYQIYYTRTIDGGKNWSSPLNVSNSSLGGCSYPDIAIDNNGNVNIAWFIYNSYSIFYTGSTR